MARVQDEHGTQKEGEESERDEKEKRAEDSARKKSFKEVVIRDKRGTETRRGNERGHKGGREGGREGR